MSDQTLLDVRNLTVAYRSAAKSIKALSNVNLTVGRSEIIAIVGESGSGKSTLGLSIINLLQKPPAVVDDGQILFNGKDLLKLSEKDLAAVRGTGISMIFQDPLSSLDPVYTVGAQISEAIDIRERRAVPQSPGPFKRVDPDLRQSAGGAERVLWVRIPRSEKKKVYSDEVVEALRRVQIADPERVLNRYPPPAQRRDGPEGHDSPGDGPAPFPSDSGRAHFCSRRDHAGTGAETHAGYEEGPGFFHPSDNS